jgi:hypothetical protein
MRFLSRASLFITVALIAWYSITFLPIVNNDAAHLGAGYFWAWLLVTMPITLRYWILPFTFGRYAFRALDAIKDIPAELDGDEVPATGRRVTSVLVLMLGFFVSTQVSLHFIIEGTMNDYLDKAAAGDVGGAVLLGVWLYVLHQLIFTFVFPLTMAIFVAISKSLSHQFVTVLAIQYRGYIRGGLPFMTWTLH